ncbi:hypothetical protein AOB58_801 [Staphylococcus sp. AntiMn-1]|uniref:hypothetical protein n=1 Tax=Staphylococcus sp. AntiMn-1 TaxID=1715860 RepID=UPI0007E9D94B|nr:hypothetical protein [Staphylococcus sp. AntiMn-1]ANK37603.1 hypothetical protein AOB58_801 [Staphylococcus sp. AntiMn-1]
MKKVIFLLLASFLVLAACGQEESKLEDKKETKASDKESNKDDKKKDEDKKSDEEKDKSDDKSNEEVANEEPQSQEQQITEEPVQSQEQVNTQEQQPVQSQEQATVAEEQQKPSEYEDMPNGDAMFDMPGSADGYYSNDQLDPDTGLPKDDAVPHKNGEGPLAESEQEESDWVKGQDEWMNASESERTEIRKADAEKYGYEYDPSDYE